MTAPLFVRAAIALDRLAGSDPFLDPADRTGPNVLDTVDPAWGLPGLERRALQSEPCAGCGGLGFVATSEDGDAGYRPCHRCPTKAGAA